MGFTGQQHKTWNLILEAYSITSVQKLWKLAKRVEDQTYSWQSRLARGMFIQDSLLFCHPLAYNFQGPPPPPHSSPQPHPQYTPTLHILNILQMSMISGREHYPYPRPGLFLPFIKIYPCQVHTHLWEMTQNLGYTEAVEVFAYVIGFKAHCPACSLPPL